MDDNFLSVVKQHIGYIAADSKPAIEKVDNLTRAAIEYAAVAGRIGDEKVIDYFRGDEYRGTLDALLGQIGSKEIARVTERGGTNGGTSQTINEFNFGGIRQDEIYPLSKVLSVLIPESTQGYTRNSYKATLYLRAKRANVQPLVETAKTGRKDVYVVKGSNVIPLLQEMLKGGLRWQGELEHEFIDKIKTYKPEEQPTTGGSNGDTADDKVKMQVTGETPVTLENLTKAIGAAQVEKLELKFSIAGQAQYVKLDELNERLSPEQMKALMQGLS